MKNCSGIRMISQRRRTSGGCLSWLLTLGAILFLFLAVKEYYPFLVSDIRMKQLQEEAAPEEKEEPGSKDPQKEEKKVPQWADRKIDWKKLKKTNPDIIAWIVVPGTKIDYPVLSCHRWNEYLHKDYEGKDSRPGSIFVQPETAKDFSDFHTFIYGHNMRNKSMFGSLHKFEDESFFKKHKKIYVFQPGRAMRYTVFAAGGSRDGSETYRTDYKDRKAKEDWLRMIRSESYIKTEKKVTADDIILTLSTCANGGTRSSRYTVHGVRKEVVNLDE